MPRTQQRRRLASQVVSVVWLIVAAGTALAAPPPNDEIDNARVIGALPYSDTLDTSDATVAPDDPFCFGGAATVWYSFTPAADMRLEVSTVGSNYTTSTSIYTGSRGSLTQVLCGVFDPAVRFNAIAGTTYHIRVGGNGTGGLLQLSAAEVPTSPPPANDEIENARVIGAIPFSDTLEASGATVAPDDPSCFTPPAATVWYSFRAPVGIRLEVSPQGSGYATTLSVYTGSRGSLTQVACSFSKVRFTAAADLTYYIMVASSSTNTGTLRLSAVEAPPPPNNDEIENARVIGTIPYSDFLDTSEATTASDDPSSCGTPVATVWYSFTPAADIRLVMSTSGSSDGMSLSVYTGSRGSLTQVGCGLFAHSTALLFSAKADTTYKVMVSAFNAGGQLRLSLVEAPHPPDNDDFDDAKVIPAIPFAETLDTTHATTAADDPFCFGQGATVWYSFTSAADVRLELNTIGSGYSATLSVYTGPRGALTQIACNAFSSGPHAQLRFEARANVTYHIMVGSTTGGGGNLRLAALLAPPPFTFGMEIDARGSVVASTGAAMIRGMVTCSKPAFVSASGSLRQQRPGQVIDALFFTGFFCEGTMAWSAPVFYSPRTFRGRSAALFVGGRAEATLSAQAFSPSEGEFRSVTAQSNIILIGAGLR